MIFSFHGWDWIHVGLAYFELDIGERNIWSIRNVKTTVYQHHFNRHNGAHFLMFTGFVKDCNLKT